MRGIMVKSAKSPGSNLSRKHEIFCEEYVRHGDRIVAYETAYPECSHRTARQKAYELFARQEILDYIQKLKSDVTLHVTIDAAWVVQQHHELYQLARVKGELGAATRNVEGIGKTMGIYQDNLMVTGDLRDISDEDLDARIRETAREISDELAARGETPAAAGKPAGNLPSVH